jgi:transcriptional regulator with XRE-family HTH domain
VVLGKTTTEGYGMTVEAEAGRLRTEADEPGWEVDPDDEWGVAVIATVGRQLKLRREAVGIRAAEFGTAVGYGEDMVYKIEGGKRIPRQEYLVKADEVLGAGGLIAATWEDVKKVRYPKKVRDLAQMEAKAVELQLYDPLNIHGLLQTPEYARGLLLMRRPAYTERRWSGSSRRAWPTRPSSNGIRRPRSASSWRSGRCGVPWEARRCCATSWSTCLRQGSCGSSVSWNCGTASSGRRLSRHVSRRPSSTNCWGKHDPQHRPGVVQEQLQQQQRR